MGRKFTIIKSRKPGSKRKFLIFKNGKLVGRTNNIGLDLRPVPFRKRVVRIRGSASIIRRRRR